MRTASFNAGCCWSRSTSRTAPTRFLPTPTCGRTLNTEYFPNQFTVIPHNGDKVKVGDKDLAWHALDSTGFNVKLFRFAYGLNKTTYGVIFWAVTVVNSPREIQNARMAVGVNGASIWWVNGRGSR